VRWLTAPLLLILLACAPAGSAGTGTEPPPSERGAMAAPGPRAIPIDFSPEAIADYRQWILYEMNQTADLSRDFNAITYPDGVFVCTTLMHRAGEPHPTTEKHLMARLVEKGWTGTGAAAVIKASLSALCPRFDWGYRTYFDTQVETARREILTGLPWGAQTPMSVEVGWFVKSACGYLQTAGSAIGLEQHLHSLRPGGSKQGDPAAAFVRRVPDDVLLRRATHKAVFAGCLGYHQMLNGYWTMA